MQVVPAHVEDWRLTGAGLGAYRRNIDKMLPIGLAISNAKMQNEKWQMLES